MKISKFARSFVFGLLLLLGHSSIASAKVEGCWADFFEYAQYIGEHFRLEGPIQLRNLRNVKGDNWDLRIDSIMVGPRAKVTVYENIDFKLTLTEMAKYPQLMKSLGITEQDIREESEIIFPPKEEVHHLGEYNFHKKVRSIKIECVQ